MKTVIVVLILALIGALVWWAAADGAAETVAPTTVRVRRADLATTVLATGAVRPRTGAEVRVGARISGTVRALHANTGDRVEAGATIAEIDPTELAATVDRQRAELALAENRAASAAQLNPQAIARAQAEVAQLQASVALLASEADRDATLHDDDLLSTEARDRGEERLAVARARLAAAEAERTAAESDRARAQLAEARTRLGYATITAPIDGVVASVSTQQGETIAAGLNAPTFVTIIDLARLQVDAYVDEIDIGALAVGQTATFTVDAYPGHTFTGRITAINPTAVLRDNVVSYVVEIAIEQPADDAPDTGSDADADDAPILRPEMTAAVTIATERLPDALVLPARAIHRRDGTTVVHRLQDGTPRAVPVTIGRQIGGEVQLLDGVAAGDTVLLDPPQNRDTP